MEIQPTGNAARRTPEPSPILVREAATERATPAARADTVDAVKPAAAAASATELADAVKNINKSMQALSQSIEFSIDDDTRHIVVKVVDLQTQEVIRQMPSVEAIEIAKALDRVQGLLIRQKA